MPTWCNHVILGINNTAMNNINRIIFVIRCRVFIVR